MKKSLKLVWSVCCIYHQIINFYIKIRINLILTLQVSFVNHMTLHVLQHAHRFPKMTVNHPYLHPSTHTQIRNYC